MSIPNLYRFFYICICSYTRKYVWGVATVPTKSSRRHLCDWPDTAAAKPGRARYQCQQPAMGKSERCERGQHPDKIRTAYRHQQGWYNASFILVSLFLMKRKRQKIVWTKPLNPKTKTHRTSPYQSLSNTSFSLLYSHEGYPKQLTIHNSRMVQHAVHYYCNSALPKLYTQQLIYILDWSLFSADEVKSSFR